MGATTLSITTVGITTLTITTNGITTEGIMTLGIKPLRKSELYCLLAEYSGTKVKLECERR